MKIFKVAVLCCASALVLGSCNKGGSSVKLRNSVDSMSYSIGVIIGTNLKENAGLDEINDKVFAQAIREIMAGKKSKITPEEADKFLNEYMMQQQAKVGKKNLEEGKKFLDENKKKSGIVTLASGVQYQVINEGSGACPKDTDMVTVNYTGTLIDGTVFDSSVERGQPASFPVNRVIPGWSEALKLMKPGAKWKVFIPSELAYGERGAGGKIKPNAVLIFEIELISIGAPKEAGK
jgi:FKBP-type peptidyl-prolyl cis-trans isomerase FklB